MPTPQDRERRLRSDLANPGARQQSPDMVVNPATGRNLEAERRRRVQPPPLSPFQAERQNLMHRGMRGLGESARELQQDTAGIGREGVQGVKRLGEAIKEPFAEFTAGYRGEDPPSRTAQQPDVENPTREENQSLADNNRESVLVTVPTGRDAHAPNQRDLSRSRSLSGANITEGPAGMQRQVRNNRTRYIGQGGSAEFQGTPRGGGGFVGARTNAEARARQDDYRARGLNTFGNDMTRANQMNEEADRSQMRRLQNRMTNPEFRPDAQNRARQGLETMQQGQAIQSQERQAGLAAAGQAQQQQMDNEFRLRETEREDMLAGLKISQANRSALNNNPFSHEAITEMYTKATELSVGDPAGASAIMARWAALHGGLFDPQSGRVLSPEQWQELPDDLIAELIAQQESLVGGDRG